MIARSLAALLVLGVAPLLSGCPSNLCLLEVNGRCEFSSCASGEAYDNQRHVCVCERGRFAVNGACLTQQDANRSCGRGAVFTPAGCQAATCAAGYVVDLAADACVPKQDVDRAAGVGPGQTLACPQGTVVVVNGGAMSCLPVAQSCQSDETWNGQACVKVPQCGPGFDLDHATMQCVQVAQRPASQGDLGILDTVQWSRVNFGDSGGQGSPQLCGSLAKKPLAFGVLPGGSARVVASISVSFGDGTTTSANAQATGVIEASGQPLLPRGAQELSGAVETLVTSLRAQKAKAQPPSVQTTVKCTILNGAAPVVVPSTGGA